MNNGKYDYVDLAKKNGIEGEHNVSASLSNDLLCVNDEQSYEDWLYNSNHNLRIEIEKLKGALEALVSVKDYKDKLGKDDKYKLIQPLAWKTARAALNT